MEGLSEDVGRRSRLSKGLANCFVTLYQVALQRFFTSFLQQNHSPKCSAIISIVDIVPSCKFHQNSHEPKYQHEVCERLRSPYAYARLPQIVYPVESCVREIHSLLFESNNVLMKCHQACGANSITGRNLYQEAALGDKRISPVVCAELGPLLV